MTATFEITDGSTTLDLTGACGFQLLEGFNPQVATPPGDGSIPPYLTEVIPVRLVNTCASTMATDLQSFHTLQWNAARYRKDRTWEYPVRLKARVNGEPGSPLQALVKSLSLEFRPDLGGLFDALPSLVGGRKANIIVTRHPYWEADTARALPGVAGSAGLVIQYDYTGTGSGVGSAHDIVGNIGARIEYLPMQAACSLGRIWMGIRGSVKHSTASSFSTLWECEVGVLNASESGIAITGDATASDGSMIRLTETDLDWDAGTYYEVVDLQMSAKADPHDNFGTFLWLLRGKVGNADTTWETQLRYGYANMPDGSFVKGNVEEWTNTTWDIAETDVATTPLRDLKALPISRLGGAFDDTYSIQIWARRTSGSDPLDLDCLIPIPMDEGYLFLSDFDGLFKGRLGTSPRDEWYAVSAGATLYEAIVIDGHNFTLPPGDGRIIIAWAREATSVLTDTFIDISTAGVGDYVERWLSLRGGE